MPKGWGVRKTSIKPVWPMNTSTRKNKDQEPYRDMAVLGVWPMPLINLSTLKPEAGRPL